MITTKNIRRAGWVWLTAVVILATSASASASSLRTSVQVTPFDETLNGASLERAPMQSRAGSMSSDSRYTVFWSHNDSVVAGDTNQAADIFVYNRLTTQTQRFLIGVNNTQANNDVENVTISADGRYIVFTTRATNTAVGPQCISGYGCAFTALLDRQTSSLTVINQTPTGQLLPISNEYRPLARMLPAMISADGSKVLFGVVANSGTANLYVRDVHTGSVTGVNIDATGHLVAVDASDATVSANGRYVAFSTVSPATQSDTNEARDVYVRDIHQAKTILVSHANRSIQAGNNTADSPVISADGSSVVYQSSATNLVATPDSNAAGDIFTYAIATGQNKQISTAGIRQANGNSFSPSISASGAYITFISEASNLTRQPDTAEPDVFLYYQRAGVIRQIPRPLRLGTQSLIMGQPAISDNGRAIVHGMYTQKSIDPGKNARNLFLSYDPVVDIPFYDPEDFLDLL